MPKLPTTPTDLEISVIKNLLARPKAKNGQQKILGIINFVRQSEGRPPMNMGRISEITLAKESDVALPLIAKTEAAGISSKAYLAELIVLTYFAVGLSQARRDAGKQDASPLSPDFIKLPSLIRDLLARRSEMHDFANQVGAPKTLLFLGRGPFYAAALEAALKTKKMTGIPAEGVAGGEFRYGLLHSIEKGQPVIIIAPSGSLFGKLRETIKEINLRHGKALVLTDMEGAKRLEGCTQATFVLPSLCTISAPVLYTVALQLFTHCLSDVTLNRQTLPSKK